MKRVEEVVGIKRRFGKVNKRVLNEIALLVYEGCEKRRIAIQKPGRNNFRRRQMLIKWFYDNCPFIESELGRTAVLDENLVSTGEYNVQLSEY